MSSRIAIETSRGSQFQNEFHITLAKIEPVTVASSEKTKPRRAAAAARASSSGSRVRR